MQQQNIQPQTQNLPDGSASPDSPKDDATSPPLYNGVRGLAVKILTRVDRSDAYLDKLLDYTLSNEPLDTRDRRLLKEITTGVLRQRERLDWVLTGFYHGEFSKCIPIVKNALRVALYQILFLDRIPHSAAVNESVELIKRLKGGRSAGIVNGVLRNIIRKLNAITWPLRDQNVIHYLSVMGSHPQWMVRRWTEQLGIESTEALLKANTERPPVTVRVNTLTNSVEKLRHELESLGITVDRSLLLPNYLHLQKLTDIAGIEAFNNGGFTVQDDGAGLVVTLTGVQPGNRVIDLCAAPGGKSVAMADMMQNKGEIISIDKYEAKLKVLSNAVQRSKFSIIQPTLGDATTVQLDPADVVLVDAPCSGLEHAPAQTRNKMETRTKRDQGPSRFTGSDSEQCGGVSKARRCVSLRNMHHGT